MADVDTHEQIARRIRNAYATLEPIAPFRDLLTKGGIEAAYAVQELNTAVWLGEGRRLVGRKIGLTAETVQRQLGVDQPDFGALFADMCLTDGEEVRAVLQPRVEAEVAIVLGRDLCEEGVTIAELLRAMDYLLPAIEVVGSRVANWDISILDTIADNASSGAFVLGTRPILPRQIELRGVGMTLDVDGVTASVGSGAACLGHPYRAALWLARRMVAMGSPLRAGDTVMTGALGPMVPFGAGSTAIANIEGLGSVRVRSAA